jgi:hypothetical protein
VSDAPRDERLYARAQLETFAKALYSDPTAALAAMRQAAHLEGTEAVRQQLEEDFKAYGSPAPNLRELEAQRALRDGGLAEDLEGWLRLDHTPPQQRSVPDTEIERALDGPDAESLGRRPRDAAGRQERNGINANGAGRQHLSPDEEAVLGQVEAFAAARERAKHRVTTDAQLLGVADHLAYLKDAEAKIPAAREALTAELPGVFTNPTSAEKVLEDAMKEHGPAETARRIRSNDLLAGEQKKVFLKERAMGVFPRRDHAAEAVNRERVAKRIETIAVCEGDLGKWSTYQPLEGAPVNGAQNVKAALELDRARIISDGDYNAADVREIERSTASKPHPALEAEQLERSARANLESLSPASRERVVQAARSGSDAVASAIGYLQTIQMATRTIREGIEGPGQ